MNGQKHILLCLAGLTPQIITETLYALIVQRGQSVDEIRVITTLEGRNRIMASLLADPAVKKGKFYDFCRDFNIDPAAVKFNERNVSLLKGPDLRMLEDIRAEEENIRAGDQICEIVRELTKDPNIQLHASAAGGRKTMSIYLTAAMQLFGRPQDKLSHVLVNEDFETHPDFFYIPPAPRNLDVKDRQGNLIKTVSTDEAQIDLADIPFIRLRGLLSDWLSGDNKTYNELVVQAQEELEIRDEAQNLNIRLRSKKVSVAGREAKLTEGQFFIYVLLARLRKSGRRSIIGEDIILLDDITRQDIEETLKLITSARGEECDLENLGGYSDRFKFVGDLADMASSSNLRDRDNIQKAFSQAISKLNSKIEDARLPERYQIDRYRREGQFGYILKVEPERIILL